MHSVYTAVIVRFLAGLKGCTGHKGHKIPALKSQLFKIDRDFVAKCKAQPAKSKSKIRSESEISSSSSISSGKQKCLDPIPTLIKYPCVIGINWILS